MRDKTEQIIKAAIRVFSHRGFVQATTQEIAKEAEVAEITLYRKFSTKQNLFVTVVKKVLENKFESTIMKLAEEEDTRIFFKKIIQNRLDILSRNQALIKMLLSESLMGHLPDEINLPTIIYDSLKKSLEYHFQKLGKKVDCELCARSIGGILVGYIVFPTAKQFDQLSKEEQDTVVEKYVEGLMIFI